MGHLVKKKSIGIDMGHPNIVQYRTHMIKSMPPIRILISIGQNVRQRKQAILSIAIVKKEKRKVVGDGKTAPGGGLSPPPSRLRP